MGFKTITIKEDAYDLVKAAKREGESFTDLFKRKFENDKEARLNEIMKYAGIWSDMTDEEYEEKMRSIRKLRRDAETNFKERLARAGVKE